MIKPMRGIPQWMNRLHHRIAARRCRKHGHLGPPLHGAACVHCGYIFGTYDDPVPPQ